MLFINPIYIEGMEEPKWRSFAGGRVNTLWMIPINEAELDYLRKNGIEELIKQCPAPKLMHIFSGTLKFLPYSASPDFVRMS
ncbi:suppressor of fused domain protein [Ruminococcus flavefaciens]|uniref:suppressor of fused domain protein n=1 Tax=Ruminococcus flavefaciens TaxID=1265 RepID=UPI001566CEF5|nr:suppressor of fused domain protein [Ruminococcus flavefaciens]MBQ6169723.1 suppressor of fused domain protein [Ruminococcus sp.]